MSTSPSIKVPPESLDASGVSLATTPASADNPRMGTAYNPDTLAAATPVWFHPTYDGKFLMLSSRIWSAAAPSEEEPGFYSSYTESTAPHWGVIDGATGQVSAVQGVVAGAVPTNSGATDITLVGAASRPPALLFALSSVTLGGDPHALLQRFHLNASGAVALALEEILPTAGGVVFDKGLQYATPNLVVYGTDEGGVVHKISKQWGKIGYNVQRRVSTVKYTHNDWLGDAPGWSYFTGVGFSDNPENLAPVTMGDGSPLTTAGPMSFARFGDQTVMTTVDLDGTTYSGQFWVARTGRPFAKRGSVVPLGDSVDESYLGGGIQLMGQLTANPQAAPLDAAGVLAGIPYVTWTRIGTTEQSLKVEWNLFTMKL